MSFAIDAVEKGTKEGMAQFQFPFRRDELCNARSPRLCPGILQLFQFPFRRDELCNNIALAPWIESMKSFNSLFVGMSFAIYRFCRTASSTHQVFQFPFRRDELCNSCSTPSYPCPDA